MSQGNAVWGARGWPWVCPWTQSGSFVLSLRGRQQTHTLLSKRASVTLATLFLCFVRANFAQITVALSPHCADLCECWGNRPASQRQSRIWGFLLSLSNNAQVLAELPVLSLKKQSISLEEDFKHAPPMSDLPTVHLSQMKILDIVTWRDRTSCCPLNLKCSVKNHFHCLTNVGASEFPFSLRHHNHLCNTDLVPLYFMVHWLNLFLIIHFWTF